MSFSASVSASIAVQGGMTFSAPLSVSESGLILVDELIAVAGTNDIAIGLQNTKKCRYLLITFQAGGGSFKVNGVGTSVPMEAGGSIQIVGKISTPDSAAARILDVLEASPATFKLEKIEAVTSGANTTIKVAAVYDAT